MSALLDARPAVDFDGLYRHHAPSVYRYTYAVLGNHADAEDVTQQTFLRAYRACAQGTKPRKAENWLLRIAHNEVRRHFRSTQHKAQEVELVEEVAQPPAERSGPSLADVLRALRRLPPTQREALVMREFEGRSYAETAQIMGMSQSALEAHTFRARRALAEQLEEAFTCGEAEEAVMRRLDRRLPRRVARRLKAHLQECRACVRFETVQRRQRAVLKGLSVLPIPASLFLFRARDAAAASLGPTAVAAGGSAAVGGGSAVGVGGAGVAAGVAAKVAAVAAAAAVAGGVGYGVSAGPPAAASADRQVAQAPALAAPHDGRPETDLVPARVRRAQPGVAPSAITPAARMRDEARSRTKHSAAKGHTTSKPDPGTREKTSPGHKPHPVTPAATKPKPKSPKTGPRPAGDKVVGKTKTARPKHIRPSHSTQTPKQPHPAKPALPNAGAKLQAKESGGKLAPLDSTPPGQADPGGLNGGGKSDSEAAS
jgi:RNA polymerase sigma factor (sigma-70 family)